MVFTEHICWHTNILNKKTKGVCVRSRLGLYHTRLYHPQTVVSKVRLGQVVSWPHYLRPRSPNFTVKCNPLGINTLNDHPEVDKCCLLGSVDNLAGRKRFKRSRCTRIRAVCVLVSSVRCQWMSQSVTGVEPRPFLCLKGKGHGKTNKLLPHLVIVVLKPEILTKKTKKPRLMAETLRIS